MLRVSAAVAISLALSACVTTSKIKREWEQRQASQAFREEKARFMERLGGKEVCWREGVSSFALAPRAPSNSCVYPAAGYTVSGKIWGRLKVLQVTSAGFLVQGKGIGCHSDPYGKVMSCWGADTVSSDVIFIHKTDERGVVDGSRLDDDADPRKIYLYESTGPFTYAAAHGATKTIPSFKKLPATALDDASKGLKVYDPKLEAYAQLEMWRELNAAIDRNKALAH